MGDETPDWPREKRQLPPGLIAAATANPGGSVAEIDGSVVRDPGGYVPVEAIIGVFPVGPDGRATGDYLRNPRYGPVRDDFTKLESPDHWLGWLPDTPGRSVRTALEEILAEQVAGAVVEWVKIVEEPVFLTVGVRSSSDPGRLTVRRAAIAVVFALGVQAPKLGLEILTGVFSWAAVGLDRPGGRRDRTWLDLGMSREHAEELLRHRVHQVDEGPLGPALTGLLNVLFGRLSAPRVHAVAAMKPSTSNLGLELAILRSIALNGFISLGFLSHEFKVSSGTVRDRIYRLQMSGFVLQERSAGEGYYVGSAGRAFLRLCTQLYELVNDKLPLTAESTEILKTLGAEPFELSQSGEYFGTGDTDRNDPKSVFFMWVGKVLYAAQAYGADWEKCKYKYADDERDVSRWLSLQLIGRFRLSGRSARRALSR